MDFTTTLGSMSVKELIAIQHCTDAQLRARRCQTVFLELARQRKENKPLNHQVFFYERKLIRELNHHRNIFIDDALDMLEILLDIGYDA